MGPRVYRGTPGAQLIPYSTLCPAIHIGEGENVTFWDIVANLVDMGNSFLWTLCEYSNWHYNYIQLKPIWLFGVQTKSFISCAFMQEIDSFDSNLWVDKMSRVGCSVWEWRSIKNHCKAKSLHKLKRFKLFKIVKYSMTVTLILFCPKLSSGSSDHLIHRGRACNNVDLI